MTGTRRALVVFAALLGMIIGVGLSVPPQVSRAVGRWASGRLHGVSAAQLLGGVLAGEYRRPWMRWVVEKSKDDGPCPALYDTPVGPLWAQDDQATYLEELLQEQLINSAYQWDAVTVQPGDIVVDVGAHIGTFVRVAFLSGAAVVVGVEPDPASIACLKRNFAKEAAEGRFLLVEAALWDSEGPLQLGAPGQEGTFEVEGTTMDAALARLELDRVDFIKMDIEGAERNALRGAKQTIAEHGPRMAICVYHRPDDPVVIPQTVKEIRPSYSVVERPERPQQIYFIQR